MGFAIFFLIVSIVLTIVVAILVVSKSELRGEKDKYQDKFQESKRKVEMLEIDKNIQENEIEYLNKLLEGLRELNAYEFNVATIYIKTLAEALDKKHEIGYSNKLLSKKTSRKANRSFADFEINYNNIQLNLIDAAPKKPENKTDYRKSSAKKDTSGNESFASTLFNALTETVIDYFEDSSPKHSSSHSSSKSSSYNDDYSSSSSSSSSSSYDSGSSSSYDSSSSSSYDSGSSSSGGFD